MSQLEVLPNLTLHYLKKPAKGDAIAGNNLKNKTSRDLKNNPPIVLLHGFTGSAETMKELADTQTDHTTFSLDLVGHGKTNTSIKKSFSFKSFNIQLKNFCREIGSERIHLLGYSMGGRIALHFATSHSQYLASLTLISVNPGLKSPYQRFHRRQQDRKIIKLIQKEGIEKFTDFWMAQPLFLTQSRLGEDWLQKAHQQRLSCNPEGLSLSLKGLGLGKMPSLWRKLSQIDTPTLIITGTEDKKFTQIGEKLQNCIKNSQHLKIENTGHGPHLEAPEVVGRHIHNFLPEKNI